MKKILTVAVMGAMASGAWAQVFGAAADYNAFVLEAYNGFNSDSEGKVAVGGNATIQNYDIGLLDPGGNALVVGGNLSFTNGTIRGNSVVNGSASYTNTAFTNGGSAQSGMPLNFGAAGSYLMGVSDVWESLASTGTAQNQFGNLNLSGSNANLNVFNLTAAQLSGISSVNVNVPEGAAAIINVAGSSVSFPSIGYSYNGSQDKGKMVNVAWHMPDISNINMSYLGGTMFAPRADVKGTWGVINGQLIANSWDGPTQQNWARYKGADQLRLDTGAVPEPGTMIAAAVGGAALMRRRQMKAKAKARAEA
jgi:choice-of-anchor A domain-containing protein